MQYTTLGPTNIEVSKVCLGCMGFGDPKDDWLAWTIGYEDSREVIKYALDEGITFFDTANVYSHGLHWHCRSRRQSAHPFGRRESIEHLWGSNGVFREHA